MPAIKFLATVISLISTPAAFAGDLDAPNAPIHPDSAMHTLEDIYNRLDIGITGTKRTGSFVEPSTAPGSTGHTLDNVMGKAPVADNVNGVLPAGALAGKTYWSLRTDGTWGPQSGTMPNNGEVIFSPGTADQSIEGFYSSTSKVAGDTDLASENIKSGITIFGVAGNINVVDTSTGDAVEANILSGKKAWVDGSEITGTRNMSAYPALVPESGQTTQYDTNDPKADDGAGSGVDLPTNGRFTDNRDGTVTDELTGLTWLEDASCPNAYRDWQIALSDVVELNTSGTMNSQPCENYSGTPYSDWRLPTVKELNSLINFGYFSPALSNTAGDGKWTEGEPFSNLLLSPIWSSTTHAVDSAYAWVVEFSTGKLSGANKVNNNTVWPVRGGQ